ncbi:MAG TPA: YncE family protein [Acidisarcina sp.]|nr:YncE family protein [Acidisarcina sp.]
MLSLTGPKRPWWAAGGLLMLAAVCGCGSTYRPVVVPINPTGPAPQPATLVVALSQQNAPGAVPDPKTPGVATILNFSGDSILAQAFTGPGPIGLALSPSGGEAYTLNHDQTISSFPVTASLMTKNVNVTTLLASTTPANVLSTGNAVFLSDSATNQVDFLTGSPVALKQAIPVEMGPVTVVGNSGAQRVYSINQMVAPGVCDTPSQSVNGKVDAIEESTNTVSGEITVGACPVYGVASSDNRRVFILNRGSGTVSVIDGQTNQLNAATWGPDHQPCPYNCQTISVGAGPVYAQIYQKASILVTANYDSNTVSFIDISTDVYGNNSSTFGRVLATVPVGHHPATVAVLQDGTRAYTANQGDGTVSVVDMTSFTVKKTITVMSQPRSVAAVSNALIGKVYVTSPTSSQIIVIRTDTDTISASVDLPGWVVDLRTGGQVAGGSNSINASRIVGSGTP